MFYYYNKIQKNIKKQLKKGSVETYLEIEFIIWFNENISHLCKKLKKFNQFNKLFNNNLFSN